MPKRKNRPQSSVFPIALMVSGLILLVAAVAFSLNRSDVSPAPAAANNNIPYANAPRLGLADAKAAFDEGSAIFVDVRGEPYYSQGHIPGALLLTEADLDSALAQLDPQAWIITYCT